MDANNNTPVQTKDLDLDSYISNYTGHTKIRRLHFIAEKVKELEVEALSRLIDELKKTQNTSLYKDVVDKLAGRGGPAHALDQQWIDQTDKRAAQKAERLEQELNEFRNKYITESIRIGHKEVGDFYYDRGDLISAQKSYVRGRDYCSAKHLPEMCLDVVKVSLELGNYSNVLSYVAKAETPDLTDKVTIAKLNVCSGLAHLENKKYKLAAKKFLETTFDLNDNFRDVISSQDIAIYGGLCALESFDRQEIKEKVLNNSTFKNFLEMAPEVRELINDFYNSRYASCLAHLEKLKADLTLDLYLHSHIQSLYDKIRSKALVQYFSPFTSVDMHTMAEAFNTSVLQLEKELARLIMENQIHARIDSHNKRLYARQTDQRNSTFEKSLKLGEDYDRNTKAILHHLNLIKNDFIIKNPKSIHDEKRSMMF